MLNLHQLADEMNRDRIARAEDRRPARQPPTHSHNLAAIEGAQAIRQALDQIDAIIERASSRLGRTAGSDRDSAGQSADRHATA